ncbi:MAG: nucleoside deaminase [Bacteroidia bacterium]
MEKSTLTEKQEFMREAIRLSHLSIENKIGGPFGAVIVRNNKIIAKGTNEVASTKDPTAHAEMVVIRNACKTLNSFLLTGCEIYTSCEPCPMCLGAIYWAKIDKVYFANTKTDAALFNFDDRFIYDELKLDIDKRKLEMVQLCRNEAIGAFETWSQIIDKISY